LARGVILHHDADHGNGPRGRAAGFRTSWRAAGRRTGTPDEADPFDADPFADPFVADPFVDFGLGRD
jgi:hypothetical protein